MGLTVGKMKCINCRDYRFKKWDLDLRTVQVTEKRGDIAIPVHCPNCDADMAVVMWMETQHNDLPTYNTKNYAIAYLHTINDEPCYDKDCERCYGNGKGWWNDG